MAFTVEQLDHIVLTVANIHATADFYAEVLGMDQINFDGRTALRFGDQRKSISTSVGMSSTPKAAHPMPGSG